jgi:large subunit ribosomal protein L30
VSDKTPRTIHIKLVRSGIGFSRKQKYAIRCLGLRRLNQVVARPDTPQIRGLVDSIPHLVKVVSAPVPPAWAAIPEYTLKPPEVAPVEVAKVSEEPAPAPAEPQLAPVASPAEEPAVAAPVKAEAPKGEKPAKRAAPTKTKAAKGRESKKKEATKTKMVKGKAAKPAKTKKK